MNRESTPRYPKRLVERQEREELFGVIREIQAANAEADPEQVMKEVLVAQQSVRRTPLGSLVCL